MNQYLGEKALANKIIALKAGDCPYTLFLGAGASISSGIPLANNLIFEWKNKLFLDLKDNDITFKNISFEDWISNKNEKQSYKLWNENNNPEGEKDYSLLFSTLYQTKKERQLFIEQIIDNKKPAFGYLFLAGLISIQKFNRILTTNFDDLISDALFKYYDIKPINCAFDSMVSGIRIDSQRPKIIKLHGDFLYDNLKNTRIELKSLDSNIEEKMFEMCKDRGLIVVGYSGMDKSVMNPISEMLRKSGYLELGLHWCFIENDINSIPKDIIELKKQYSNKVFFYRINNFDSLMETMFEKCKCLLPEVLNNPNKVNPIKDFQSTVIDGTRTVDLSSFQIQCLSTFLSKNIKKEPSDEDLEFIAENFYAAGKNFQKKSNNLNNNSEKHKYNDLALEQFQKGIDIIDEFINRNNQIPENLEKKKIFIYALRRKTGLLISYAKIILDDKNNIQEFIKLINEAIELCENGIDIHKNISRNEISQFISYFGSFYYNICCAFSLLFKSKKKITENDKENIFKYIDEINKLYPDKSKLQTLFKDNDFEYFKNKNLKEIENKYNLKVARRLSDNSDA